MEERALQTYLKDEVVNIEEQRESPLADYESPPPGLALCLPIPFPPPPVPCRPTLYPLFLQGNSRDGGEDELEEDELGYPDGCMVC